MANKVFILADDVTKSRFFQKARAWRDEPNQKMFVDNEHTAVCAVAEFIANERGFTTYECNAKYKNV